MPDPIQELGRKLLRHGVPCRHASRIVQELREHRDDLETEGRAAGLPTNAARSAACERLGNIDVLGEELLATKLRAYWCGRHPLITFVLLPLPLFFFLFLGLLWLGAEVTGVAAWSEHRDSLPEPNWAAVRVGLYSVVCVAVTLTAAFTCFLARRSCCGFRWTLIGCTGVFLHTLLFHTGFTQPSGAEHGLFWMGYSFGWRWLKFPDLIAWAAPVLAFAVYYLCWRRTQLRETIE